LNAHSNVIPSLDTLQLLENKKKKRLLFGENE